MDPSEANEVFARGQCASRSLTHPCAPVREGPLLIFRDGPRTSGDRRNEVIIVHGVSPDETVAAIRSIERPRYSLAVVNGLDVSPEEVRRA